MKRKHSILTLFLMCFTFILATESAAQEDFPSSSFQDQGFQDLNSRDDKPLIYEAPEGTRVVHIQGDSLQQAAGKTRKGAKKTSGDAKEKDALSFNFLYYIIQKYKFSDIVDQ